MNKDDSWRSDSSAFLASLAVSLYLSTDSCDDGRDDYIGPRRRRHAVAQVEARVGRLVVRHVLPGDAQPVDRVVHQRVEAVLGRDRRREDAQLVGRRACGR